MYKFVILLLFPSIFFAQQTLEATLMHDGAERDYLLYIPENYNEQNEVPLVINYHGYGSSNVEQIAYGDFRSVADTAGFILAVPQGLKFNGETHWNVQGWIIGSPVDDVDFTSALIDAISEDYSINSERIYATGMSNGGFMSFLLACQLSDKIAAVASVTGSMTPETFNDCSPSHPTPVLYIHGDSDSVVPYNGAIWTKPVSETINYWKNYNQCEEEAVKTDFDDVNTVDGSTVEKYFYDNLNNYAVVEHYKVIGGDHTWPGTIFNFDGTNQDINASEKIWQFFAQYDLTGKITVSNKELESYPNIEIYPNPVNDRIYISRSQQTKGACRIYDQLGNQILLKATNISPESIDVSTLDAGVYFIQIEDVTKKFIKL